MATKANKHYPDSNGINADMFNPDINSYWWKPIADECREAAKNAHFQEKQLKLDSQSAYLAGDGRLAKDLSIEAKQQKKWMHKFNTMAANTIYLGNNHNLDESIVDLDGLFKDEAVLQLRRKINNSNTRMNQVKCMLKTYKSSSFEIDRMKRIISQFCDLNGYQYHEEANDGDKYLVVNFGNNQRRRSGITDDTFLLKPEEIPIESLI